MTAMAMRRYLSAALVASPRFPRGALPAMGPCPDAHRRDIPPNPAPGQGFLTGLSQCLEEVADLGVGQGARHIRLRDDTDEPVPVDDRQPAYLVLAHRAHDLSGVVIGADGDRLTLRQLSGLDLGRVLTDAQDLHDDVAVGQHALELVVRATDRQRTDAHLRHLLRGLKDRLLGADALCAFRHDLACRGHRVAPILEGVVEAPAAVPAGPA
ncbi:hypothetical protein VR46_33530 [Streptomyces sp. NRRL S-444]|nr:hypothetical protein VR46_33530 [Streptomyces sp. NRRL S-444]